MWARPDPLVLVKSLHTVIWAFFAGCILAIPVLVYANRRGTALVLIGIVTIEVLVIVLNGWRCPLTNVAARYTPDRRDNKTIFGSLYFVGVLYTVARLLH